MSGPVSALARAALAPVSLLWALAARSKNLVYDAGLARPFRAGVPVVSIGNITVGGTGKTPITIHIARRLLEQGLAPVVLSRGYGSSGRGTRVVSDRDGVRLDPRAGGDEPCLIAASVPGLAVVVDRDRIRGARESVRLFRPSVILLDDGFQHRRLARDLDIVVVDATDPFGGTRTMPSGRLREPLRGLARADLFVVTRAPHGELLPSIESGLRAYNAHAPIVRASHEPESLVPHDVLRALGREAPRPMPLGLLCREPVYAFCGIGTPEAFRVTLQAAGARLAGFVPFRDHHAYTASDLDELARRAREAGAVRLVTTEKDAVRLPPRWGGMPVAALRIRMEIPDEATLLRPILELSGGAR